ncbi:hypothetical protein DPEC_G00088010 [Dallia pectoralis]|uniref:Uncharacterized protein n=1 Tax=Dallia pectoralis TaxID=75939 RepID=A0ACC2H1C5_DALPE|nr:hypothetical protein DPEC_G00088010 [Dallia pectoralis]
MAVRFKLGRFSPNDKLDRVLRKIGGRSTLHRVEVEQELGWTKPRHPSLDVSSNRAPADCFESSHLDGQLIRTEQFRTIRTLVAARVGEAIRLLCPI